MEQMDIETEMQVHGSHLKLKTVWQCGRRRREQVRMAREIAMHGIVPTQAMLFPT
jgi:hypothetical protein